MELLATMKGDKLTLVNPDFHLLLAKVDEAVEMLVKGELH